MRDSSRAKFLYSPVGENFSNSTRTRSSLTELVKANITRYDFSEGIFHGGFLYSGGPRPKSATGIVSIHRKTRYRCQLLFQAPLLTILTSFFFFLSSSLSLFLSRVEIDWTVPGFDCPTDFFHHVTPQDHVSPDTHTHTHSTSPTNESGDLEQRYSSCFEF